MQYKLYLTLRQKAALQCAIQFWRNKNIQDKVVEFFESCWDTQNHNTSDEWGKFTKKVIEELNKDELPQTLVDELIHIIKMIGERILGWHYHIKNRYATKEEAINCIDKIRWTPYGTVDAVQIFKSTWLDNPSFDTTKLYEFACKHVMVDYVNDVWNKIPSGLQDSYNSETVNHLNQHILLYWKCCRDGDLSKLMRYLEIAAEHYNRQDLHEFNYIYDLDRSTEVNMLRLSAHQGYFVAVKYFWEKLTEEERDENVLKCTRIAVSRFHYHEDRFLMKKYLMNQYAEICIFLMNQMTRNQKKEFFNKQLIISELHIAEDRKLDVRDQILKMLLSGWPWQELFMVVFKDMIQLLNDDSKMVCYFLESITKKMMQYYDLNYSIEMGNYRNILREAWLTIPGTIKRKLAKECPMHDFISYLMDMRDLDSLRLILNDPEIVKDPDVRDRYIIFIIIRNICDIWTKNKNNLKLAKDLSSEFLNCLFESEGKAVLFKKEMFVDLELNQTILYYFAELERKNILKDLLIWFLTPDEEIQRIELLVAQRNQRL